MLRFLGACLLGCLRADLPAYSPTKYSTSPATLSALLLPRWDCNRCDCIACCMRRGRGRRRGGCCCCCCIRSEGSDSRAGLLFFAYGLSRFLVGQFRCGWVSFRRVGGFVGSRWRQCWCGVVAPPPLNGSRFACLGER